jgi:hypothetical protein
MSKLTVRIISLSATAAAVGTIGFAAAPAASAAPTHKHPTPLSNVGDAVNYVTDDLQHNHLDQPLLGLGPTLHDPVGWTTGPGVTYVLDVVSIAVTGRKADGSLPGY